MTSVEGGTRGGGLVTFGEALGRLTSEHVGLLESGRPLSLSMGGAESNVAIGAARLGADVTWAGRLGSDSVGDLIERRLRAEGVTARLTRGAGFTGLMVCSRRTTGALRVDYHRAGSAASQLSPADIGDELVRGADILHVTGITPALGDSARDTTAWAVRTARDAGVTVSFDVNFRSKLWGTAEARPVLQDLLEHADILFAGPEEAALVLGVTLDPSRDDRGRLARLAAQAGPREVVIKDGSRGCLAVIDGHEYVRDAPTVSTLDPVGAGDAFVAGYLTERLQDVDPQGRLTTALQAGAYAVTVPGDCEGLPFRHELDDLEATTDILR